MKNKENFVDFKENIIEENENKFGKEIRSRYGNENIDASNDNIMKMDETKWNEAENLRRQINIKLKAAFELGDPESEEAQAVCELHKKWLCIYWKKGTYTKEAHRVLAESYVADKRFTAYYDELGEGCTEFLKKAIEKYTE